MFRGRVRYYSASSSGIEPEVLRLLAEDRHHRLHVGRPCGEHAARSARRRGSNILILRKHVGGT